MAAANTSSASEIMIYTTLSEELVDPSITVPTVEYLVKDIPKDKRWILVIKSDGMTTYVDAYNKNGKLDTRIFYEEPQDIFTKTSIGFVHVTAYDLYKLAYKNNLKGMTYGLNGGKANCQTFIKEILKKFFVDPHLKTNNDDRPGGLYVETERMAAETFNKILVRFQARNKQK